MKKKLKVITDFKLVSDVSLVDEAYEDKECRRRRNIIRGRKRRFA
jgi:hypothetical protein